MKFWRMSFRAGNQGHEMWPECLRLSVAAITYLPLATTDISRFPEGEPKELWSPACASTEGQFSARRLPDAPRRCDLREAGAQDH